MRLSLRPLLLALSAGALVCPLPAGAATVSNVSSVTITVVEDPLFVLGTILGKVFHDADANGRQDPGEPGLSGVRLAMEDGTLVTSDPHGRYSIPGIIPGRHLLSVDFATLPPGAEMTTDRARHVKMTDGLLARANFGVRLPQGSALPPAASIGAGPVLEVQVVPLPALPNPRLELLLEPSNLEPRTSNQAWQFRLRTNYPAFIHHWRLSLRTGAQEVRVFQGQGPPPARVAWDGHDAAGAPLILEREHEARLEVSDAEGRVDRAALLLRPVPAASTTVFEMAPALEAPRYAMPLTGAAVVSVKGTTEPWAVVEAGGLELEADASGAFEAELIVPKGTGSLTVESEAASGERTAQTHPVRAAEDYFFLVALGETEIGHLKHKGRLEAISAKDRDRMERYLYADGRLAYYLKAKLRGKYLITSSFDLDRERKELFRQLDEDEFYPVYGDASTLNYDAADTQDELYLMIEWDKSYAQWGNYGTGLTGAELANYNRSLHGLKVHHESLSATSDGAPTLLATIFAAKIRQQAAHDELRGTGGTLYYLRRQDVIEGSEKVAIEVRDKISQRVRQRAGLAQGKDYDMDYAQGRLHLYRPLASVAGSGFITSSELLNGDPAYLVVDYEFEPANQLLQEQAFGGRIATALGDRLTVGATYANQEEAGTDYELQGADAKLTLWPGTTLRGELAHSTAEAANQAVSADGGLTYTNLTASSATAHGDAWQVALDSKVGPGRVEASYQSVDPGFTNFSTLTRQGTTKLGFRAEAPLTPSTSVALRHDSQRLLGDGNAQSASQLGAQETHTTSAQVIQRLGQTTATGEYRHQERDRALVAGETSSEDLLAARVERPLSDRVTGFLTQQVSLGQPGSTQSSVGLEAEVAKGRTVAVEQTVGHLGDATRLRLTEELGQGLSLYTDATWRKPTGEAPGLTTSSGVAKTLSRGGRLYLEDEFRGTPGEPTTGRILGVETPLTERVGMQASFERSHTESRTTDVSHNAAHLALSYAEPLKVTARSEAELRYLDGASNERQIATRQEVKYTPVPDLTLQARLEYARTENTRTGRLTARSKELHLGAAYRPIRHDRLNFLGRYIRLEDKGSPGQVDADGLLSQQSQILSVEGAYDLGWNLELVEGLARRDQTEIISGAAPARGSTYQWLQRVNYHLTDAWDLGVEYRLLRTRQADDLKQGFSVELDRTLWENFQAGIGYNFTKYAEDITATDDFETQRWFIRLTSKFASLTPEELARNRQLREELRREALLWRYAQERLSREDQQQLDRLNELLLQAEAAAEAGDDETAQQLYAQVLKLGDALRLRYSTALEERLAEEDRLAAALSPAHAALRAGDYGQAAQRYEAILRDISRLR